MGISSLKLLGPSPLGGFMTMLLETLVGSSSNYNNNSNEDEDEASRRRANQQNQGNNPRRNDSNNQGTGGGYEQSSDEDSENETDRESSDSESDEEEKEEESTVTDDQTDLDSDETSPLSVGLYIDVDRANPNRFKLAFPHELDHTFQASVVVQLQYISQIFSSRQKMPVIKISGLVHRNMRSTGNSEVSRRFREDVLNAAMQSIVKALTLHFNDQHTTMIQVYRAFRRRINFPMRLRDQLIQLHRRQRRLVMLFQNYGIINTTQTQQLFDNITALAHMGRDRMFMKKYPRKMKIPRHYRKFFPKKK